MNRRHIALIPIDPSICSRRLESTSSERHLPAVAKNIFAEINETATDDDFLRKSSLI